MSDPSSDADDSDDALPVPAQPEPTESEATKPDVGHETSLTAISISQITRQVQLFVPSMIQVIGDVADRHPDIAHKIVDDIIDKGQHRQEIERVVVRGNDRRADRGQLRAGRLDGLCSATTDRFEGLLYSGTSDLLRRPARQDGVLAAACCVTLGQGHGPPARNDSHHPQRQIQQRTDVPPGVREAELRGARRNTRLSVQPEPGGGRESHDDVVMIAAAVLRIETELWTTH
ncbi:hypothetical protein [Candidatus Poriferisodalis sp.]|uniref:hypothetical protein n=1 Tax=Candidatus Poriferisodalis sp. TaxID=3101277 RepID=UPI003B5B8EFD